MAPGCCWCLLGKHSEKRRCQRAGEASWIKGGGQEPRSNTQITARLICLSQPPKAAGEEACAGPSNSRGRGCQENAWSVPGMPGAEIRDFQD